MGACFALFRERSPTKPPAKKKIQETSCLEPSMMACVMSSVKVLSTFLQQTRCVRMTPESKCKKCCETLLCATPSQGESYVIRPTTLAIKVSNPKHMVGLRALRHTAITRGKETTNVGITVCQSLLFVWDICGWNGAGGGCIRDRPRMVHIPRFEH